MAPKNRERNQRRFRRDPWMKVSPRASFLLGILMFFAVPVAALLLLPLSPAPDIEIPEVGDISTEEIIAPYDFPVKQDAEVLGAQRQAAAAAVPPVLAVDENAGPEVDKRLSRLERELLRPPADQLPVDEFRESVARRLGVELSPESVGLLMKEEGRQVLEASRAFLLDLMERAVVPAEVAALVDGHDVVDLRRGQSDFYRPSSAVLTVDAARDTAQAAASESFQDGDPKRQTFIELTTSLISPNAVYDREETERRRQVERAKVKTTTEVIHGGQRIIDSHERVTAEHVRALESLVEYQREALLSGSVGGSVLPNVGRFAAICLLLLAFKFYLRSQQPEHDRDMRSRWVLTALGLLAVIMVYVIVVYFERSELLVPVTALPLLAALLLNRGVALFIALLAPFLMLAFLIPNSMGLGPQFLIGSSVGGIAAVLMARNVQRRHELYLPVLLIGASYALVAATLGMALKVPVRTVVQQGLEGVLSAIMAGALTMVLLPVFEKAFKITTNFTLLELLDRNHPLLRRMAHEAPGTFHHSMLVAELAREAVQAIGGNPLLAQVGAYYHDIGKMEKPEYFIENQTGKNVHDKLTPTMSCLVLGSHVREGVIMAREAGLPREIIDFIPEHHGTTLMSYFFHKAKESDENVDETDFRYPGPRPNRKETAVVMLADSVEATARSILDPTPGTLRTVVRRLIDARVADGQLDTAVLTLSDLAKVKESFYTVLSRFFHARIQYPGQDSRTYREGGRDGGKQQDNGKVTTELKVAPQGEEVPPRRSERLHTGALRAAADGSQQISINKVARGDDER